MLRVVGVPATGLEIEQTDKYVVGEEHYTSDVKIINQGGSMACGILYRAADAFLGESDSGYGFTNVFGTRNAVGCSFNPNNMPPDRIEEWIPSTGGNNFYEAFYSQVWSQIGTKTPFPDTCRCADNIDNGAGISWNFCVAAGESVTYSHVTTFSPLGLEGLVTSKTADSPTSHIGAQNGYTITITNPNPNPVTLNSITDTLPAGFSYVLGSTSGVTTNDPAANGQMLSWSGPFIVAANSSVSLHFAVIVASISGDYFNEAGGDAAGGYTVIGTGPTAQITALGEVFSAEQCCGEKPHFNDPEYATYTGRVAVTTSFAVDDTDDEHGWVLAIFDLKDQENGCCNYNYVPPFYHGPTGMHWTRSHMGSQQLGSIFGVTLDETGNIYTTASTAYSVDVFPNGGTGGEIYKIDGITGLVSTFHTLPNTGHAGLGNITYDCVHERFYVSDIDNGLIYELDQNGNELSSWDHGHNLPTAHPPEPRIDDDSLPFTPLGRRVWGLQAQNGRLYYGIWWEDLGRPSPTHANEIWSIALDANGGFVTGTDQLEITMPVITVNGQVQNYSNPVSDISFGPAGTMLLTERSMSDDSNPGAHQSRAVECALSGGVWTCDPAKFRISTLYPPGSCAGGGDYDFSAGGRVWVSGDALHLGNPDSIYGLQGLPSAGGSIVESILIDLNRDLTSLDKTRIGDVEVPCPDCEINGTVVTPSTIGGPYTYQFTITNHSNQAASTIVLLPISGVTSIDPPGFHFDQPLLPGQMSRMYTVTLNGVQPGVQACFNIALVATNGSTCCSQQLCVPIPSCFEVLEQHVDCLPNNMARLTMTIKNLETYTLYYAEVIPWDPSKTATPFTLNPPVPPLGTTTIQTIISPVAPGETVLYTLTVHYSDLETCCSRDLTFTANCAQAGPGLLSAVSRMTHGAGGDFDIPLPLDGTPGIEDRGSAPGSLTLVFTFDEDVAGGDAMVMEGAATVNGPPTFSDNQMFVNLTGVADAQTIKLQLDVMDINGHMHSPQTVRVSILYGDVTGNGVVNASDVALTKSHLGEPVNSTNFRSDVNKNGSINASDVSFVKSHVGDGLP